MADFLLIAYAVAVPLAILCFIYILRDISGLFVTGGADIMGVLLAFDAAMIFDAAPFSRLLNSASLVPHLTQIAGLLLIVGGFLLTPICIIVGEKRLTAAIQIIPPERRRKEMPLLPRFIVFFITGSFIIIHLLVFMGTWSWATS